MSTPQTTVTHGYFNGNKYRMTINSNALRLNITLEPGEFVRERSPDGKIGRNINDPRLDAFATPNGLSKQLGDPVPVVNIASESYTGVGVTASPAKPQPTPVARPRNAADQVQRLPTHALISDRKPGGIMPPKPQAPSANGSAGFTGGPIPKAPAVGVTPAGINPAVRAMSVKEAEENGIIGRARRLLEGPDAESGLNARNAPYADQLATPGAERRMAESTAPRGGPRVTISTPVGKDTPTPAVPVTLTDAEVEGNPYEDPDSLPVPDLGEDPQPSSPVGAGKKLAESSAKPFVCAADGKAYAHYSTLSKYVHKTYPDRADELLAPYRAAVNAAPGE